MSIFDAMRGLFGFPPRPEDHMPHPRFRNPTVGVDDDVYGDEDDFRTRRDNNFSFNMFSGDFFEMHKFFEQQMDEMLKSFQSDWFSDGSFFGGAGFSDGGGSLPAPPEDYESDPRKKFLKPAYVNPPHSKTDLMDSDIDNEIDPSKVLDMFPDKKNNQVQPDRSLIKPGRSQMTFSSQVVKKRMLPNGAIEEERKCIKNGQEEVHLSRQLGDMKHIVTTIKLPDGTTESHEEFINMDEDKLSEFNKSWNSQLPQQPQTRSIYDSNLLERSLFDLLKNFIP